MTPAERARAWYPSASSGGGNKDTDSGTFLWKPVSDGNGKCAVHTPANVRIKSISVNGKEYGFGSYGNGYRPLFRLDKPGGAFGSNVSVHMNLHGGGTYAVVVPSGAKRFEKSGFPGSDAAPAPGQGGSQPPVEPPKPASSSIELPASYAGKVGLVAIVQGRKFTPCTRDPLNPARWTHPGRRASRYGIRWDKRPGGSVATYNGGLLGLWSVTDGAKFLTLPEILELIWNDEVAPPVIVPPVVPPAPPTPPPVPPSNKDAELTATGLRLAPDLVPLVEKVLVLTNAETPAKTVKFQAWSSGFGEWTTGKPLSFYPAAVYQLFWRVEPPARIPHHQGFPGAIKNVSHVNQAGKWAPPTTRNP